MNPIRSSGFVWGNCSLSKKKKTEKVSRLELLEVISIEVYGYFVHLVEFPEMTSRPLGSVENSTGLLRTDTTRRKYLEKRN